MKANDIIALPDHPITYNELIEILLGCLTENELVELAEDILYWIGKKTTPERIIEEYEYWAEC